MKCSVYIKMISATLVDILQDGEASVVTADLISLLSYILHYICLPSQESMSTDFTDIIHFFLQVILDRLENTQTKYDMDIYVRYLTTLYTHSSKLMSIVTQQTTLKVWQVTLTVSKTQQIHNQLKNVTGNESNTDTEGNHVDSLKATENNLHGLMALIISSCDTDHFKAAINLIVEDLCLPCHPSENKIKSTLSVWKKILSMSLTQQQGQVIVNISPMVLMKCGAILDDVKHLNTTEVITNIVLPVLSIQADMLTYGNVLLEPEVAVMCLNSCHQVNLDLDYESVLPMFRGLADIMYSFFMNHTTTATTVIPTIITITKLLYKIITQYGSQDRLSRHPQYKGHIQTCANLVTRLCNLFSKEKVAFGKVAMYVIADYCTEVQKVTLLPLIKRSVVTSIYHLLDVCDEHRIKQLQTILPQGVKDVFLMLHQDYTKYHKYVGKS